MPDKPRRIGYIRISPTDQNPNVQTEALKQAGCTDIYESTRSEAIGRLLDTLQKGDTLVVYRLDRISRDAQTLFNFQQQLKMMSVTLTVIADMPAATRGDNDE